jgi:hypothetical protein
MFHEQEFQKYNGIPPEARSMKRPCKPKGLPYKKTNIDMGLISQAPTVMEGLRNNE